PRFGNEAGALVHARCPSRGSGPLRQPQRFESESASDVENCATRHPAAASALDPLEILQLSDCVEGFECSDISGGVLAPVDRGEPLERQIIGRHGEMTSYPGITPIAGCRYRLRPGGRSGWPSRVIPIPDKSVA